MANKTVVKGAVNKSGLTAKGVAVVMLIAVVGGLVSVFLNNNVPQVAALTQSRGAKWYNPLSWF